MNMFELTGQQLGRREGDRRRLRSPNELRVGIRLVGAADLAQLSQILALVYYGSVISTIFSKGSGRCTDPRTEGASEPSITNPATSTRRRLWLRA